MCFRLEGFLRRNGHPHQRLNPETDPEAKALIDRFHVDAPTPNWKGASRRLSRAELLRLSLQTIRF